MKKFIIPAIIAGDAQELNRMVDSVKKHASLIQLDIMDGNFVQNRSLDFEFDLREDSTKFEAHCMVSEPEKWIERIWRQAHTIIVHFESCLNPGGVIDLIKKKGCRAGMAIRPETRVEAIGPLLDDLDQVLVMTVDPGFYGSPFIPETSVKVEALRGLAPAMDIEVDGGITPQTIAFMDAAGANKFVSGSFIVKSGDIGKAMLRLQKEIGIQNR
jgi:ribulose-phosphate 3-epimerase